MAGASAGAAKLPSPAIRDAARSAAYASVPTGPPSRELARQRQGERRVRHEVATRKSPRLGAEPVQPLEPRLLHPGRGPPLRAAREVEDRPDAQEERGLCERAQCPHEELLLRGADPAPDNVHALAV